MREFGIAVIPLLLIVAAVNITLSYAMHKVMEPDNTVHVSVTIKPSEMPEDR